MDAIITYDEVVALVGINTLTFEPHPNFEKIWMLCRHFERALQHLPCLQSIQQGWKGIVMAVMPMEITYMDTEDKYKYMVLKIHLFKVQIFKLDILYLRITKIHIFKLHILYLGITKVHVFKSIF
jgi:hypothetical protein